ncbi:tetraacyldisaccharide 4'-kinase [Neisseriaceae bacterium ESL0693]|nr:tetraacyldisaccharide 4'-kinase [Neisseriaceae bacterium ESL0693]
MAGLFRLIEQHWQQPKWYLTFLLWPLARLFQAVTYLRRSLYRLGILKSQRLSCAVLVVGNIHAGGVGKTPVVAALIQRLQAQGIKVGVISRGYGRLSRQTLLVNEDSSAKEVGDEPLMLFQQTKVPLAVATRRLAAAEALLQAYPETQLIISDDGLQHYALARDFELVVFPAADAGQKPDLLPNGPLRESCDRLKKVDMLVISGGTTDDETMKLLKKAGVPALPCMYVHNDYAPFYRLHQPQQYATAEYFRHKRCAAVAAIGHPERFFQALIGMGIDLAETRILADHATIETTDWPQAEVVFITEKDAVKLPQHKAGEPEIWILPLKTVFEPDLTVEIVNKLNLNGVEPDLN